MTEIVTKKKRYIDVKDLEMLYPSVVSDQGDLITVLDADGRVVYHGPERREHPRVKLNTEVGT